MRGRATTSIYVAFFLAAACGQTATPAAGERPSADATAQTTPAPDPTRQRAGRDAFEPSRDPAQPSPVVVAPTPAPKRRSGPGSTIEFVVPRRVTLVLGRVTVHDARTARLDFLVPAAGNGCVSVGPLVHSAAYSRDRLIVRIQGYERSGEPPKDAICTADVQHATASIDVDREWLAEGDRTLVVVVRGQENRLAFDYADYYATLGRPSGSNVRTRGRTVGLFPMDVGELYVAGNVHEGTDYRDALREFAYDHGWEPADETYEGIRQPDRDRLFVVVRDRRFPPQDRSEHVGRLSRGVRVYLTAISDTPSYV